jgi:hypothetical protein
MALNEQEMQAAYEVYKEFLKSPIMAYPQLMYGNGKHWLRIKIDGIWDQKSIQHLLDFANKQGFEVSLSPRFDGTAFYLSRLDNNNKSEGKTQ